MDSTTFDYEFERHLRSVTFAIGWIDRRLALRRLLQVVERMALVVRYQPTHLELAEVTAEPTYAWCPRCRLNKQHDVVEPVAMLVVCRVCDDEHTFSEAS